MRAQGRFRYRLPIGAAGRAGNGRDRHRLEKPFRRQATGGSGRHAPAQAKLARSQQGHLHGLVGGFFPSGQLPHPAIAAEPQGPAGRRGHPPGIAVMRQAGAALSQPGRTGEPWASRGSNPHPGRPTQQASGSGVWSRLKTAPWRGAGTVTGGGRRIHASSPLAAISWPRFACTPLRSIAANRPSCPRIRRSSRVNSLRRTRQGSRSPEGARS